jgi:hypothetical protein
MSNPWFRLYSEAVDDEKLRLLAFEDRWHFIALLCCKNNGILDTSDTDAGLMRRKVAVKLGLDLRELGEVARRLAAVGLINEESLQPIKWNDRQFKSDTSAERTRAYRDRMKRHRDVTVTAQETHTETDTESDSETEVKTHTIEPSVCVSAPTNAGLCCKAIKAQGIPTANPSNPTLLALIEAGATEEEFSHAAIEAVQRGNSNFNYVIGIVKRQREQAAKLVLHKGRMPTKEDTLYESNRAATAGWMPPELRSQQ